MPQTHKENRTEKITRLVALGLGLPWIELVGELWKQGHKLLKGLTSEGLYEVLDYESTLEIHDQQGKNATVNKKQKVRYLQNNIIAYQDQAWGDGDILIDYQCSPGTPVDRYRSGHKTITLISLRQVRDKGDEDELLINWNWKNGFLADTGFWGTQVDHRTKQVCVQVILPEGRPPRRVHILEGIRKRQLPLTERHVRTLPDGRWLIQWEKVKPRLYENYILKWEW